METQYESWRRMEITRDAEPVKPVQYGAEHMQNSAELDAEWTAGDVYDDLHERAAQARTRALMGERAEALNILERARADYAEYRDILEGLPLASLEHAFEVTMRLLCDEQAVQEDALPVLVTIPERVEHKPRARKRAPKAA